MDLYRRLTRYPKIYSYMARRNRVTGFRSNSRPTAAKKRPTTRGRATSSRCPDFETRFPLLQTDNDPDARVHLTFLRFPVGWYIEGGSLKTQGPGIRLNWSRHRNTRARVLRLSLTNRATFFPQRKNLFDPPLALPGVVDAEEKPRPVIRVRSARKRQFLLRWC